jgi:prepilin-type N-terminal cleavage/methylation domain-containing protein
MRSERGFSLIELLVATTVMLIISGTVTSALLQMTSSQQTIWNRAEMHSGVRSATELLQQEVGQAGRITLPGSVTFVGTAAGGGAASTVQLSSIAGMFANQKLTIGTGAVEETVTITAVDAGTSQVTATFTNAHGAGSPVRALGGFAEGIVPTNATNGSTGTRLKLFGDINGDGSMVYVEYFCDTEGGNLYRNSMAYDAGAKPDLTNAMILLANVQPNPDDEPCFTYEEKSVTVDGTTYTFVIDVAITLTVQTQAADSVTKAFQRETKALLNVAPRNIFHAWELASAGSTARIQPTPATVTALLP